MIITHCDKKVPAACYTVKMLTKRFYMSATCRYGSKSYPQFLPLPLVYSFIILCKDLRALLRPETLCGSTKMQKYNPFRAQHKAQNIMLHWVTLVACHSRSESLCSNHISGRKLKGMCLGATVVYRKQIPRKQRAGSRVTLSLDFTKLQRRDKTDKILASQNSYRETSGNYAMYLKTNYWKKDKNLPFAKNL